MPRVHYLQTSFVAGVLDPRMAARTDVRQYYQGMSRGDNVVPVPLGGCKRRPGQKYVAALGTQQTAVHTSATETAPNGGTAANASDDSWDTAVLTTVNISTTNPYVVVHYDLGSALTVNFVDVVGLSITAGSSALEFAAQSSTDNVAWTTQFLFTTVDTIDRSRRVNIGSVSARYWRVARIGATDLSTAKAQLRDFLLWTNAAAVSEVRLKPFAISTDDSYVVSFTDRSIGIYETAGDTFLMNVPSPYANAQIDEVDHAQAAESMILTHEDVAPRRLLRDAIAVNWDIEQVEFTNIPDFDFNDALSPAVTNDVQDVTFTNFVEGNTFALELEGARTGVIVYQGVGTAAAQAATAANIARAVQKLYTVGLSGVACAFTAGTTFRITFGEDSADNHQLISGTPLTAGTTAAITAVKIANGVSRREPVWSATRGWPRSCTFHEGRLWFGGSRSLPLSLFGSVVNDFFNFDLGAGLDDDAIFITLATAQLNKVVALFSGRDLQVFTSGGEFRFLSSPITPATAAPKNQTQYGAAPIKPVSTDGATVFIQKTRKVLRDFLFRYEEDAYSSVPLSALSAFLLSDVRDMAAWQGDTSDDANLVMLVNADGTLAMHVTLRSQEIAAWSKWTTAGLYKAVCSPESARYCAVQRTINGSDVLYLERFDESYRLDAALRVTFALPGQSSTGGLVHLNGELCRVRDGNIVLDDATPAAGSVNLTGDGAEYFATDLEVGLDWQPVIVTMPLNNDFGNGDNFLRKKRVVKARIDVYESLGLLYNDRILPDDYWDLDSYDEAPDPYTGVHPLEESSNYVEGGLVQTISQRDPLPFHVRAMDISVETS
jgi:hypothetical protein